MNLRALKLYGLSQEKPSLLSNWLLIYCIPGLFFLGFAIVSSVRAQSVNAADAFGMAMGAMLIFVGLWGHIRQRRIGLSC